MNDVSYLLDNSIYPALYTRAISIFPEFEFKNTSKGYISGNTLKITGENGDKQGGVYYYSNNVSYFIDYTRGSISIWDYVARRDALNTNKQVLERLAELAGVALPELNEEAREAIEAKKKRGSIYEAMQSFFIKSLEEAEDTEGIKKYIKERGLKGIEEVGYIPSKKALEDFLKASYSEEEYKPLLNLHKNIGNTHKLTIAYRDPSGSIVGFIFRQLQSEDISGVGKYLYSTGLEVSKNLFNLNKYTRRESVILVEGILDSLAASKVSIENVIAIGSNNLGKEQVKRLSELKPKDYTLLLDNDTAGEEGTKRAIDTIIEVNPYAKVYIVTLPEGIKDPDQFIKEKGKEELEKLIKNKNPFYLYLGDKLVNKYNLYDKEIKTTREDIINFKEEAFNVALKVKDPTEIDFFTKGIENWTGGIITKESFKEERERRLEEYRREEQKKKLNGLLYEVGRLSNEGNTKKAIETLNTKIEEVRQEESKDLYTGLTSTVKEEEIRNTILNTPESLYSGYKLNHGGSYVELNIPTGAITVVGARTSHGKTAFLMNLALNVIEKLGDKTLHFFSYEESKEAILIKLMNIFINKEFRSGKSNLDYIKGYYKSGGGTYKNEDFLKSKETFFNALIDSGKIKVHFSSYEVSELVGAIEFTREHDNAGAIFIDYLQRIPIKDKYSTRQLELQAISGRLVDISVKTGLPIITASQFNRQVASKSDLDLSKLREAGDIEQDANLVLGLWNNKNNEEGDTKKGLYVEVLKNRDGITGMSLDLDFNGNTGKVSNPSNYDNSNLVESTFNN